MKTAILILKPLFTKLIAAPITAKLLLRTITATAVQAIIKDNKKRCSF
ncbi:MAG: hypothetical protein IKL57_07325 [Oscillospiraceae bacterium]|nr:hypothetical protein [Oscillospiraceae bacterium]MBR3611248.1 hypothetical protein [Oscillospiraceae bacterium]